MVRLDRFWKSLVRHIFSATKITAKKYNHLIDKFPETLQNIYDPNWFPESFVTIAKVPSEIKQQLKNHHPQIQLSNHIVEN